jgi:hypothetical protein
VVVCINGGDFQTRYIGGLSGTPTIFHEMNKSKRKQMFSRFETAPYFRRPEFSSTTL